MTACRARCATARMAGQAAMPQPAGRCGWVDGLACCGAVAEEPNRLGTGWNPATTTAGAQLAFDVHFHAAHADIVRRPTFCCEHHVLPVCFETTAKGEQPAKPPGCRVDF